MRYFLFFFFLFCPFAFSQAAPLAQNVDSKGGLTSRSKPGSSKAKKRHVFTVQNPGFEAEGAGDVVPGWLISQHAGPVSYLSAIDKETASEGSHSFRMERTQRQEYGLIEQVITIPRDIYDEKVMRYTAMLKTENVGPEGWALVANFQSVSGGIITQKFSKKISETRDWEKVELSMPIPKGTASIAVGVILLDSGTGWVDDVQVDIPD